MTTQRGEPSSQPVLVILPKEKYYGLDYIPQVANETNDEVFYELKRFFELLAKNNPNILELLNTPEDKIIFKHPLFDQLDASLFLSKKCKHSFSKVGKN